MILVLTNSGYLNFWTFQSRIDPWMHISVSCVNAWHTASLQSTIWRTSWRNVPLSTPLDIWWIPSWTNPGAENAELILLNKVLFTRKLSDFSFSFRIFWILPVVFLVCKPYDPWTNRHLFSSKSLDFFWVHSTLPMTSSPIALYSLTPVQPRWTAFCI